jgi:protein SCO1/2
VGFKYKWDPRLEQYAHPAVLVFIGGNGRIMRYLYGIDFPSFQLRTALIETSEGKVGNALERFIVSCYQYDPDAESYTPNIMRITRLAGALFVLMLGFGLIVFWRREKRDTRKGIPDEITRQGIA